MLDIRAIGYRLADRKTNVEGGLSMKRVLAVALTLLCLTMVTASVTTAGGKGTSGGKGPKINALIYHETTGFRHDSIPYAIQQLTEWGAKHGIR